MGISHRRFLATLTPVLLLTAACGGSSGRSVTLTATSSSEESVEVSYELDGTVVTDTVDTPWSQALEVSGDFDLAFVVTNPNDSGGVGCSVDGLGIGPPIAATGEAAAACNASGSISSSTANIVSSSEGTPRNGGDTGTAANDIAGQDIDDSTGIAAELVVVDESAMPTELTQFESFGVSLRVTGLDVSGDDRVIVDGDLEYRSPTVTSEVSASELYTVDDVVDGTLGHRVTNRGFVVVTDTGRHTLTVAGTISVPEQGIEVPFNVALEVDVEPVEVVVASTEFLDGALVLDVPNSHQASEPAGWRTTSEEGLGIERPLDPDLLDALVEINSPDGALAVSVLRSTRPLSHPELAVAAQQLNELLPLPGTITAATIGGVASQRIEVTNSDQPARLDVVELAGEMFVVLAGGPLGEPSGFAEAVAIADSVVFDAANIPRLTHNTVVTSSSNEGVPLGSYEIPADWVQDDSLFSSNDVLVGARLGFVAGDEPVDSVIATIVEQAGYLKPATTTQIDGVDFAEFGADDDLGLRRDFIGAVPGGVLVFTVFDERPEVDRLLVDAIVASLTIIAQ